MSFLRKYWDYIALIIAFISGLSLWVFWTDISTLQRLAIGNLLALTIHQFEEYRFPGGEAAITNMLMQKNDIGPIDAYPLNSNNAMVMNTLIWIPYTLPILFPNSIWLAFWPVLMGFGQIVVHVLITPLKLRRIYNPGQIGVVFGHATIGSYWFYYTISHQLLTKSDIFWGIILFFIGTFILMRFIGYGLLKSVNSPYRFTEEEMERGGYATWIRQLNNE